MNEEQGAFELIHGPSGRSYARLERASNLLAQGIGLLGRRELPAGRGLWLPGVADIHTLFMRFPIDVLFLDADFRAVRAEPGVLPGRIFLRAQGARHAVELGAGTLSNAPAQPGEQWEIRPGGNKS